MMTGGSRKGPPEPLSSLTTTTAGPTSASSATGHAEPTPDSSKADLVEKPDSAAVSTSSQAQVAAIDMPQFKSALDFTNVRDFAYPHFHPLHYGVSLSNRDSELSYSSQEDDEQAAAARRFADGPPWKEDSDLNSPVITNQDNNREYEFSVASADEIHGKAVALFDFVPENDNEVPLREGQIIWVSYRHGQGWLVAENPETGETGLVPEEYVQLIASGTVPLEDGEDKEVDEIYASPEGDSEGWVDDEEETVTYMDNMHLR